MKIFQTTKAQESMIQDTSLEKVTNSSNTNSKTPLVLSVLKNSNNTINLESQLIKFGIGLLLSIITSGAYIWKNSEKENGIKYSTAAYLASASLFVISFSTFIYNIYQGGEFDISNTLVIVNMIVMLLSLSAAIAYSCFRVKSDTSYAEIAKVAFFYDNKLTKLIGETEYLSEIMFGIAPLLLSVIAAVLVYLFYFNGNDVISYIITLLISVLIISIVMLLSQIIAKLVK